MGRRLTLNELLVFQDELDLKLWTGLLALGPYLLQWNSLLVFAGWTQSQYEAAIDDRWFVWSTASLSVPCTLIN